MTLSVSLFGQRQPARLPGFCFEEPITGDKIGSACPSRVYPNWMRGHPRRGKALIGHQRPLQVSPRQKWRLPP